MNKAKQMVPTSYDGYVIGDGILFYLDKDELLFVGRAPTVNWLQFHGRDRRLQGRHHPRRPLALASDAARRSRAATTASRSRGRTPSRCCEKLNGGPIPDVKFFTMDAINIKGRKVRALRHGMAGAPGLEIWGPYAERDEIRDAILEAGKEFGLVPVGSRAYA